MGSGKAMVKSTSTRRSRRQAKQQPEHEALGRRKRSRSAKDGNDTIPSKRQKKRDDIKGAAAPKPSPIDVQKLLADLKIDYARLAPPPAPPILGKKQDWGKAKDGKVITNIREAPKGWNPEEPDLLPDDLDAQIERCQERINDGIMPHAYGHKMMKLEAQQKLRKELMEQHHGLAWPVVQRLHALSAVMQALESGLGERRDEPSRPNNGRQTIDVLSLMETACEITKAYATGRLNWNQGFVTYWCHGKQLCLPRPFKWDEFDIIHDLHNGHTSFWVEGRGNPTPGHLNAICIASPPPDPTCWGMFYMHMSLRIPTVPQSPEVPAGPAAAAAPPAPPEDNPTECSMEFLDDTGASDTTIYEEDVEYMQSLGADDDGNPHPLPRCMGVQVYSLANGTLCYNLIRELEVNIWDYPKEEFVFADWERLPVAVTRNDPARAYRLNGLWVRARLYCATVPDLTYRLWMFDYNPGKPGGKPTLPTASTLEMTAPFV
ncbi:hypothetical protein N7461_008030 [Penicillium sp. DV-2018c]|nr:hypothetical protein N7461_008030 [Penicillium sp. DV-2018c]